MRKLTLLLFLFAVGFSCAHGQLRFSKSHGLYEESITVCIEKSDCIRHYYRAGIRHPGIGKKPLSGNIHQRLSRGYGHCYADCGRNRNHQHDYGFDLCVDGSQSAGDGQVGIKVKYTPGDRDARFSDIKILEE